MCAGVIDLFRLIGKLHVSGSQNFPLGPKLRVLFFASALPSIVGLDIDIRAPYAY